MILIVECDADSGQFTLEESRGPRAYAQEGVSLTDAEWADYQRVMTEAQGWQDRIERLEKVNIPADPELKAASDQALRDRLEKLAQAREGRDRLQEAIDAGILHED